MNESRIPWIITVAALVLATAAGIASFRAAPASRTVAPVESSGEVGELRRALAAVESEAGALRTELDRLRMLLQMKQQSDAVLERSGLASLPESERRKRLSGAFGSLRDLAPRLENGDQAVYEQMREVFLTFAAAPPDEADAFRKAFEEAESPLTRTILLPHLLARDRAGAADLLKREIAQAEDPVYRARLLENLRHTAPPEGDPEATRIFLDVLGSGTDGANATARERRAAVTGLARLDSTEAEARLLEVAETDPDGDVRALALRHLARNPQTRDNVLEIVAGEPDDRLRTIGECTARLAEAGFSG